MPDNNTAATGDAIEIAVPRKRLIPTLAKPAEISGYRHNMPFGAELKAGVGVYFRLWAPTHQQMRLSLNG